MTTSAGGSRTRVPEQGRSPTSRPSPLTLAQTHVAAPAHVQIRGATGSMMRPVVIV